MYKVGALLFIDTTPAQDSHNSKTNVFDGATVFLYFDSSTSESQQRDIRKKLRFQGARITEFYDKKVNIVLSNKSAKRKIQESFLSKASSSRGALMLQESFEKKKRIQNSKNFIQRAEMDGKEVLYLEGVTLGVRP